MHPLKRWKYELWDYPLNATEVNKGGTSCKEIVISFLIIVIIRLKIP